MPKPQHSNVDTLKAAGIIKPRRKFTQEQIEAIESLSAKQVEQLVSAKETLEQAGPKGKPPIMPGIIAGKPPHKPGKPKRP
jgi:hypothetical protein